MPKLLILRYSFYLFVILAFMAGCDKSKQSEKGNASVVRKHPVTVKPPEKFSAATVAKGKQIYRQNCIFCHQADAIGKPGVAPSLTNKEFLAIASYKFLHDTIKNGRPGTGMPPFKHLGDKKIRAIIAFIRSHAKLPYRIAEVQSQHRSQGDPRFGKLFFKQICSTCHGPGGNGYEAGGTGTAIGKKGFLDRVSDGFIRVTIAEGRSNTRMYGFHGPAAIANLSNKEIDDIIAYLRTNPGEHH